jgi:uncharacterized protein YggU (UPF0235/DUF167 family)
LSTFSTPSSGPFVPSAGGLGIRVHARPGARRDAIEGLRAEADGSVALRVSVRAAPEDGKANAAIAKLLAATWEVPKSRLRLTAGATDRRKLFVLEGDPAALAAQLQGWLTQWTERQ